MTKGLMPKGSLNANKPCPEINAIEAYDPWILLCKDLIALERAREFKGVYHVIGGLISPMDSVGPELLEIRSLVERVSKSEIDEIILALTPSVEGDTTSLYIGKLLAPFTKVTRIAYGLPMGSELEYVDEVTLARALEGRTKLN